MEGNPIYSFTETEFDHMKLRYTDAAGNWQEQTIIPAFKISSLTGIDDVESAQEARVIAIYNLQGCQVASMDAPGIYIVKTTAGAKKVLVK